MIETVVLVNFEINHRLWKKILLHFANFVAENRDVVMETKMLLTLQLLLTLFNFNVSCRLNLVTNLC